ncbi:hypothetical protein EGW08_005819 [Elysia chlorotica]|uniref:Secreted protein n=1 Tax=Elysia chlorotica TaxID=188477 RepID=A0A433TXX3_ELYCH|nr:hypothetical protein EGW08_005819 [Elysia chlorotica]
MVSLVALDLIVDWLLVCYAHGCRSGRRRPVTVQPRKLSGGLPGHALHRVQRRSRYVPLLRQQVQLLVGHHRAVQPVRDSAKPDSQGWQPEVAGQPLLRLHQDHLLEPVYV